MKSYSDISYRYMKENKKRTTLTIFGIALATILIFAIGTFILSFRDSMIAREREAADFEFMLDISGDEAEKVINNVEIKDSEILQYSEMQYSIENSKYKIVVGNYGDKGYYDKIYGGKIIEGSFPKSNNEIIIDTMTKKKLNVNIGDILKGKNEEGVEKDFTVVGVSKLDGFISNDDNIIYVYGYLDKINKEDEYIVYVNLKSERNKQKIINKVLKDANVEIKEGTKNDNSQLLYLTGNGGNSYTDRGIKNIAIFIIAIIMVCTITVIYNSFNMSVIERIRYFGILKAMGATNKQIKRIVYKEGAIMWLCALPIGMIIGFFSLKFGIKIFLGDEIMLTKLTINFYPGIILVTAILVAITIFLSLLAPVRKVKKITAVDAMKNKSEISIGKIKRRKARLITKVFGIEGSMAYKNIRRTPMRFIVTLLALTISIVIFNVFYNFMDFTRQAVEGQYMKIAFDSSVTKSGDNYFTTEEINGLEKEISYSSIYKIFNRPEGKLIPLDKFVNKDEVAGSIYSKYGFGSLCFDINACEGSNELNLAKEYVVDGEIDYNKLKDNGVILVDGNTSRDKNGDKKTIRKTNYKVGDKIKIYEQVDVNGKDDNTIKNEIENNYVEVTVVAILNKDPFMGSYEVSGIGLYCLKDVYDNNFEKVNYNDIRFKFDNEKNRANAIEYFDKNSDKFNYSDFGSEIDEINGVYNQVEFFVYCFIIIITIISVVNIFNTISTNLLLRKKEFATLKAMGMTEKQLKKTVILEGTLYGIISAIVGGILSVILSKMMINSGSELGDFTFKFPYLVFSLSIVVAILVTYLSTLIPLKRLSKLTVVEGISDDE